MEAALSIRFFDSKILFSLTFEHYEKQLKQELLACHKYMVIPMSDLMNMTVRDRRAYIQIHNRIVDAENKKLKEMSHRK